MSELRQFGVKLSRKWIALMSGGASVLMAALSSLGYGSVPNWIFWAIAIILVLVACFQVWRDEHRAAHPFDQETEDFVRQSIAALDADQRVILSQIVMQDGMLEDEIRQFLGSKIGRKVHGDRGAEVSAKCGLLERGSEGRWIVKHRLHAAVAYCLKLPTS